METELTDLIVEYLCTDHTKDELMALVERAIRLSDGETEETESYTPCKLRASCV